MLALRNCGAVGRVSLNTRTIVRRQLVTETDGLVWNEFLRLRAQRRRAELIASIPLSIAGFLGSTAFLAFKEVDLSQAMLGIDPFIFYGAVTVGCGALGWLLGPFLGQAIWKVLHRRKASLIKQVYVPILSSFPLYSFNVTKGENFGV